MVLEFELWVHDAITGNQIARVRPNTDDPTWSTNLAGTGECSWSFNINDPVTGMTGKQVAYRFSPNARLLSLRFGRVVIGAWKVETWEYINDTGKVVVTGVELVRAEAKMRMTYGLSQYESGTLVVTNRSRAAAVRAIIIRFTQWSPEWNYPIDPPADAAGEFSAVWEFWKKYTIEDLLVQVEQAGVEIFFRPYLTAGNQLRFETIVQEKISRGSKSFNLQAEDSPLTGVRYRVDGSGQLTGAQGMGEGMGQDQEVRSSPGLDSYTIPIRDVKVSFPDLAEDRLQEAAKKYRDANIDPVVQWTVGGFTSSEKYPPTLAITGSGWKLKSRGHPIYPDGAYPMRVIGASGTLGADIRTEVQSGL